jgi:hypothetical protein
MRGFEFSPSLFLRESLHDKIVVARLFNTGIVDCRILQI